MTTFKVGDRVINNKGKIGMVGDIRRGNYYPVLVAFGEDELDSPRRYSLDGKERVSDSSESIKLYEEPPYVFPTPGHIPEREYKVGDKIKIPHAEKLLTNGWVFNAEDNWLEKDKGASRINLSWCGNDTTLIEICMSYLRIKGADGTEWYVVPEHLGLPKIKPPKPEPKVGEWWRSSSGSVFKIVADKREHLDGVYTEYIWLGISCSGISGGFCTKDLVEKVNGWEVV